MTNSNTDSSTANTLYNEPRTPLDSPKNLVYQTIFKGLFVGSTVLSSSARASGPLSAGSFISKYGSEAIAQAVDQEVVKRATDDRIYKAFTLPNGLRALVVSDATASRAAAALDVNAGAFADPPEVPGIAHFCEHMLFLGKYVTVIGKWKVSSL